MSRGNKFLLRPLAACLFIQFEDDPPFSFAVLSTMKPRVDHGKLKMRLDEVRPLFYDLLKSGFRFFHVSHAGIQGKNLKECRSRVRSQQERVLQIWTRTLEIAVVPQNRSKVQTRVKVIGVGL